VKGRFLAYPTRFAVTFHPFKSVSDHQSPSEKSLHYSPSEAIINNTRGGNQVPKRHGVKDLLILYQFEKIEDFV
jgi:hypothetical protein